MATLISAADVIERFDVDSDIDPLRFEPHIQTASRRLRKWVGEANYAEALAFAAGNDLDEPLLQDLRNAEAHLAFHYMVYGLNYPFTSKGIVATVMSSEGKEMRKFLTPAETQAVAVQMLELAREIAEPYMPLDGTPTGSFEVVSDGEC